MELPKKNGGLIAPKNDNNHEKSTTIPSNAESTSANKEKSYEINLNPEKNKIIAQNIRGILPKNVLTEEEKSKLLEKKERLNRATCLVKKIANLLLILSLFFFLFLKANISENNSILSKIGIEKNMGKTLKEITIENTELEMNSFKIDNEIKEFEKKIKNKYYTLYSEDIKKIKKSQIRWFDKINDGEVEIGIIDGVRRMADFFNDKNYSDPKNILNGRYEKVEITDVSANREEVSLSVDTTQILGKIIFMNIEFIDMLNSFPIYKNASHFENFSREKNEDGDYYNNFSLTVEVQLPDEKDSDDSNFSQYVDWFNDKGNLKIKDYNIKNKEENLNKKNSTFKEINFEKLNNEIDINNNI